MGYLGNIPTIAFHGISQDNGGVLFGSTYLFSKQYVTGCTELHGISKKEWCLTRPMIDWLILKVCQLVWGYFMSRG